MDAEEELLMLQQLLIYWQIDVEVVFLNCLNYLKDFGQHQVHLDFHQEVLHWHF